MTHIAFRVDSGTAIGAGHLARCLVLADALSAHGARCTFIGRAHRGHMTDLAAAHGHAVVTLDVMDEASGETSTWLGTMTDADAVDTVKALCDVAPVDWLIVDHYAADAAWHAVVRSTAHRVMAIDDLANRPLPVDVLLDHNYRADEKPYGRHAPMAQLLLGPRYALLGPGFRNARYAARCGLIRPRHECRVLVSLGGSDPDNVTTWVVRALRNTLADVAAVDVVIGRGHPSPDDVHDACRMLSNATLHVQTPDMPTLLANADIAIGAGGVSTLERACVGMPSIALALADNQVPALRAMDQDGLHVYVENHGNLENTLRTAFDTLVRDAGRLARMRTACREAVDGHGADRVASILLGQDCGTRATLGARHG